MSEDYLISVNDISKAYRIWKSPSARLVGPFHERLARFIKPFKQASAKDVNKVSKYFTDFYALKNISFNIKKGESLGIVGRNGSGKSTLLQIIAGTLRPTQGDVRINGKVAALLELGSGFNPEFTGRENVYLNATVLGLLEHQIDERFDKILDFADIEDFIDQPVKTYSSGMMMRLAFAVIAHVDADILIVDEALAVGDVFFVQKCMRFIREFQKTGTLLLVTHDTGSVQSLCSQALWLHQGEMKATGTSKDISEQYLEATYAEKQGVSFFKGKENEEATRTIKNDKKAVKDQRLKYINQTNLRNDIKVFEFQRDADSFGAGGARISNVALLDAQSEEKLTYIVGGEEVILSITIDIHASLKSPIVGFFLKNQLGQCIFGDNTFLTYLDEPVASSKSDLLTANFEFTMPILQNGEYSITVAIADGTQHEHLQHHWIHDAVTFKSESSSMCTGLVGIPMNSISLRIKETVHKF